MNDKKLYYTKEGKTDPLPISVNEPYESVTTVEVPGAFTLKPIQKGLKGFIERLCIKLLHIFNTFSRYSYEKSVVLIKKVELDPNDLANALCHHIDQLEYVERRNMAFIIVGGDVCPQFVHSVYLNNMDLSHYIHDSCLSFNHLQVIVVPWFTGILVVPNH